MSVVLVEPIYEVNIGYIARSMKNFSLNDLFIVNPRCEIGDTAFRFSSHARKVLENAAMISRFEDVVHKFDLVAGTTAKTGGKHSLHRRPISAKKFAEKVTETRGTTAVVFGREDQGLLKEELKKCDVVVTISADTGYPVLNISHAACIIFYEIFREMKKRRTRYNFASRTERNVLIAYLRSTLETLGYPSHKYRRTLMLFRRMINRAMIRPEEAHALIGFLRKSHQMMKQPAAAPPGPSSIEDISNLY